jgi:hypothetical protein
MTKYELLGRLALLLGAAAHLPDTASVLGYNPKGKHHQDLPTIMVEDTRDLPDGERTVEPDGEMWMEHSVMVRGVKIFCLVARKDGDT